VYASAAVRAHHTIFGLDVNATEKYSKELKNNALTR